MALSSCEESRINDLPSDTRVFLNLPVFEVELRALGPFTDGYAINKIF